MQPRLIALLGLVAAIALSAWLAFAVLRSVQQRTVFMAVYPEGSLNAELVKRYQQVLVRNGIEAKLDLSAGAVESLGDLRDPKSGVSVALVPGGITTKQDSPELVSLGTVFYQPLWIFSHGRLPHGHLQLRGRRISIGPEGVAHVCSPSSLHVMPQVGAFDCDLRFPLIFVSPAKSLD